MIYLSIYLLCSSFSIQLNYLDCYYDIFVLHCGKCQKNTLTRKSPPRGWTKNHEKGTFNAREWRWWTVNIRQAVGALGVSKCCRRIWGSIQKVLSVLFSIGTQWKITKIVRKHSEYWVWYTLQLIIHFNSRFSIAICVNVNPNISLSLQGRAF